MSFPKSSPSPAWVTSPTSSSASIPVASQPVFDEFPSSYEPADSPLPQFESYSPPDINMDSIMDEGYSDSTVVIDYHEIRQQVSRPSVSNAKVMICEPDIRNPANLHEELRKAVTDTVRKEVREFMKQAKQEKGRQQEQKEDVTESTNESGTSTIQASKNSPDLHENPKNATNTGGASCTKRARTASKEMAHLSNVSFQIPEDFEVNSDTVNEFVPAEEVLRKTTTRNRKKYSFSDRLRGWDIECRMRLYDGIHQLDKYFTHVQSNITVRSVPEVVNYILYELNPKQTKEANRKRKTINSPGSCIMQDPADEGHQTMLKDEDVDGDPFEKKYADMLRGSHDDEKWVEMYLRVSQDNYTFRTSVDVPSDIEWDAWKERKAAKKKAKTTPSSTQAAAGTSNVDVELVASTLMSLAKQDNSMKTRQLKNNHVNLIQSGSSFTE